ncbi:SGNH/GDSL hydrolase family protein [Guptibacillus hwajinpoensis]|uniref:SGNH/GDSL hydrolase family protein n=1 Tax=Guptibacillus hwajinpoensis TaxID=208199 RepID=UPI001CFD9FEE|nr:SGNH/GDSL hydrolase family protein [Pseudalkalibacillus hwajinpoensis]WLR61313.1 SGNH/GDSL hydrolase family protein [Pseudalkalibacillus hwajinpoensis]
MKNVVLLIALIGCLALVIAGKFHWDDKIAQTGETVSAEVDSHSNVDTRNSELNEKPVSDKDLKKLVSNFPEQVQEKIMSSNDPISVAIVGSESIGTKKNGLKQSVEKGLEESFWKGAFTVKVFTFEEATTKTIVQDELYDDVIDEKPDIVILEAFTLNDNGKVIIDEGHQNLSTVISELNESLPGVSIMLMPSNPIADPGYYNIQINALGNYAEANDLIYLDHWSVWPAVDSTEIEDYLVDSRPNDKGFDVWGEFIVDYFSGH